jgi:hypothetical protein
MLDGTAGQSAHSSSCRIRSPRFLPRSSLGASSGGASPTRSHCSVPGSVLPMTNIAAARRPEFPSFRDHFRPSYRSVFRLLFAHKPDMDGCMRGEFCEAAPPGAKVPSCPLGLPVPFLPENQSTRRRPVRAALPIPRISQQFRPSSFCLAYASWKVSARAKISSARSRASLASDKSLWSGIGARRAATAGCRSMMVVASFPAPSSC